MKWNVVDHREHLEHEGRRRIRRQILARSRHTRARCLRPAGFITRRERIHRVYDAELPHAVFLHSFVLVHRGAHGCTRSEAQLLDHAYANFCALAVLSHVDDRLHLHVIAELACHRSFMSTSKHLQQERAHMLPAFVHTALCKLHGAIPREQVREVVPEILVEVIPVCAREIVEFVEILHPRDGALGFSKRCFHILRAPSVEGLRFRVELFSGESRIRTADRRIVRRLTRNGIAVVIRRDVLLRINLVQLARRMIRRQLRIDAWRRLCIFPPALVVARHERGIEVQRLNLPDAVALHVGVLVNAFAPGSLPAELAGHREFAAASARGIAIRCNVDHGLKLNVIVEPAIDQTMTAQRAQKFTHALLADVHALLSHLDGALIGEQVCHLVPHGAIEVVAVDALEILNFRFVTEQCRAMREIGCAPARVTATFHAREHCRCVPRRAARQCAGILVVERRNARGRETVAGHVPLAIRRMRKHAPRTGQWR